MTDDTPRNYDREFTTRATRRSRRRLGIDIENGDVIRFVLPLEYGLAPAAGAWAAVVRYDHDSRGSSEAAHDVTEDGLHIDIYRHGEKVASHELTPPLPADAALNRAEEHLKQHLEGYIRRFEEWHPTNPTE
jgi:hypothetical protein